ncbi:MAG: hypothetical protein AAF745_06900 [Planctomycetota bacterium]
MIRQLERLAMAAVVISALMLFVTSTPSIRGEELHGLWLMAHMGSSGLFVVALPVQAILFVWLQVIMPAITMTERSLLMALYVFGGLSIGTMFACMLPVPDTDSMRTLIWVHGWIGMVVVAWLIPIVVTRLKTRPGIVKATKSS